MHVQHKPACTATEDGLRLEILDVGSRGIVLSKQITYEPCCEKTGLRGCRPGQTNWAVQPHKMARCLKFCI